MFMMSFFRIPKGVKGSMQVAYRGVNRPAKQLNQFLPTSAQTLEPPGFSLEPPEKCTEVYFAGASGNSMLCHLAAVKMIREQQDGWKLVTNT
jgi:hypothetical protein